MNAYRGFAAGVLFCLAAWSLIDFGPTTLAADKPADGKSVVKLNDGKLTLVAPDAWQVKAPANRIIEYEFALPASEGDEVDGRLTVMGAGGSVDANIDRWIQQFTQPDGKATRERATIKEVKIAGQNVHLVDIAGTFADRRGPFAPAVNREGYRMLGAIIVTDGAGQYFVKLYGPQKTIAAHQKGFDAF
ncbi:MAG: hypothetical protein KDA41_05085, partial [Planctomycetales bacterium]|nr:hypothetical protein [Planctomycetales bacterium]